MLTPLITKAQTRATANPVSEMMRQRSTLAARSFGGDLGSEAALTDEMALDKTRGVAWDFSSIQVFPANQSDRLIAVQPKLLIGLTTDPLEQQADNVANQVIGMPRSPVAVAPAPPRNSRQCTSCQDEEDLQKKSLTTVEPIHGEAPNSVGEVLQSPGQPLDLSTRAFFETRFDQDFSQVRVHTDTKAAQSAQAIHARAYTSGPSIVFGTGQYAPRSGEGRRLLAHELTHVTQQTTAQSSPLLVQKEPENKPKQTPQKKAPARQDIVLLGEGWQGGSELSIVLAHGGRVIAVNSVDDAAKALAKIDGPIGTLYFVTHSTSNGALKFGKDEGFTKAADIAAKLKGSVPSDKAPQTVDFRGCSVGNSPQAMEDIRTALGAQSVVAGNCYAVIKLTTPLKMGPKGKETEITDGTEVTKTNRGKFEELYRATAKKLIATLGKHKGCLITKTEKEFFAAGGRFVALWFNPTFSADWIEGKSVCYNDASHQTVDLTKATATIEGCNVITVNAPDPNTSEKKP